MNKLTERTIKKRVIKSILLTWIALSLFFTPTGSDLPVQAKEAQFDQNELHLGNPELQETRKSERIAPGVNYTKIVRGEKSAKEGYTVEIGFYKTKEEAWKISEKLREDGYEPRTVDINNSQGTDIQDAKIGFLIYVDLFQDKEKAQHLADKLATQGYNSNQVVYTGADGTSTKGPWVVNVLEVEPNQFNGSVKTALANDKTMGKETITSMGRRLDAIAAINGGYFVVGPQDGTPGDLAGTSIQQGELVSESIGDRTSFILPSKVGGNAKIAAVQTKAHVSATDGTTNVVDGINRAPGLIRGCGGSTDDQPSEDPMHDVTCQDNNELIQYTDTFGSKTPEGEGFEAVLNKRGVVIEVREKRGGAIHKGHNVLSATGTSATWLQQHAKLGAHLNIQSSLFFDGSEVQPHSTLSVVNGGPRLLKEGQVFINAAKEGFYWSNEFFYRFGVARHPRTLAGIKENGNLLFVTVDGRNYNKSIGVNFKESAELMKSLGAVEAINLDGGGSTTMTVGADIVSDPSDNTGERPVADGIFLVE